VFSSTW